MHLADTSREHPEMHRVTAIEVCALFCAALLGNEKKLIYVNVPDGDGGNQAFQLSGDDNVAELIEILPQTTMPGSTAKQAVRKTR